MYYDDDQQLPASVRNNLPPRARRLYRTSFNEAWARTSAPSTTAGHMSREQHAHAAAWRAVRREYKRRDGEWIRLPAGPCREELPARSPRPTTVE